MVVATEKKENKKASWLPNTRGLNFKTKTKNKMDTTTNTQILENLAKKLAPNQDSEMKKLNKETLFEKFEQDIQEKSYFDSYKAFYVLCVCLAFLSQIASAYSSYTFFHQILKIKIQHVEVLMYATIAVIILIEVLKYYFYKISLQKAFALKREISIFLIAPTFIISFVSIYASVIGGGTLGENHKTIQTHHQDTKSLTEAIKMEIKAIQQGDEFKQVVWIGNGKTSKVLNDTGLKLVEAKQKEVESILKKAEEQESKLNQENKTNNQRYSLVFALFEALFIVCSYFIWHFKRTSIIDRKLKRELQNFEDTSKSNVATTPKNSDLITETIKEIQDDFKAIQDSLKPKPELTRQVGFQINKPKPIFEVNLEPIQSKFKEDSNHHQQAFEDSLRLLQSEKEDFEVRKSQFEATLKKASLKNAKYLQKYKEAVEMILELEADKTDTEICNTITSKFEVSKGTYYNIKRILNNPTQNI
jgi:hypothetical protein